MATVGMLLAASMALLVSAWLARRSLWFRKREYRRLRSGPATEAKLQETIERAAARLPASTIVLATLRGRDPPRILAAGRGALPADPAVGRFELGSVTKLFTALALARLHHLRGVPLDTPVIEIAPDWFPTATAWDFVTLHDLATHTSGLPRLPPDLLAGDATLADPYRAFGRAALLEALKSSPPSRRRRGRYLYSNYGYGLLGELLARIAGISYQQVVIDTVLRPLGMDQTSFHHDAPALPPLIPGRRRNGRGVPNWHFDRMAAAGALIGSARDLSGFLQAVFHPAPEWKATMQALFAAPVRIDRRRRVGLGWHCSRDPLLATDVWWHNGATGGYRALVAFAPDLDLGVVVLSNSGPFDWFSPSIDRLGFDVLRYSARLQAF